MLKFIAFCRNMADYFNLSGDIWIGLTDDRNEGTWVWLNEEVASDDEVHWKPGEPNGGVGRRDEDCAVIAKSIGWKTADVACTSHRFALCEWKTAQGRCST